MGHDLNIGGVPLYISFNWSCYNKIFHIREICGHDNRDGRVSRRLIEAIAVLRGMGYSAPFSMDELSIDGWGNPLPGTGVDIGRLVMWRANGRSYAGRIVHMNDEFVFCKLVDEEGEYLKPSVHMKTLRSGLVPVFDPKFRDNYRQFAMILAYFLQMSERHKDDVWWSDQVDVGEPLGGIEPRKKGSK